MWATVVVLAVHGTGRMGAVAMVGGGKAALSLLDPDAPHTLLFLDPDKHTMYMLSLIGCLRLLPGAPPSDRVRQHRRHRRAAAAAERGSQRVQWAAGGVRGSAGAAVPGIQRPAAPAAPAACCRAAGL